MPRLTASENEPSMLKLYYHPVSTYSRRVRIVFLEKKIDAKLIEVDLFNREQFQPDFLELNLHGRVPVLDHDGFVLSESTAILDYLEAIFPEPALVPADVKGRALVAMHMKLCDLEVGVPARRIWIPKRFLPKEQWRAEPMARAQRQIQKHLSILEQQLKDHDHLVGDAYTLAEVCYTPFLHFLDLMEVEVPAAVAAWTQRLLDRPSARETVPPR